jgi:hypothetical protein
MEWAAVAYVHTGTAEANKGYTNVSYREMNDTSIEA